MNYRVEKTFKSRKNLVELIYDMNKQNEYVRKQFLGDSNHKAREIYFLKLLRKYHVLVPHIVYEGTKTIHMTYIGDRTLLDYYIEIENCPLCEQKEQKILDVFEQVFQWLDNFYKITYEATGENYILNDSHFRNFLFDKDGQVYGIDFEDCIIGNKEKDGGKFCAYLLTYDPIFTIWKIMITKKLIDLLVNTMMYDRNTLISEMEYELNQINNRRWAGTKKDKIDDVMYWIKK